MPDPARNGREVAIVGMAAVFPGAADLAALWRNVSTGVDAITDVPAARWDAEYFDPAASGGDRIDRFYCRRGGFIDAVAGFDPIAFGIMPVAAAGAEPDQLLALHVAAEAVADAGGRELPRERTGVILGRGGYLTSGMARLANRVRTAQQLATTLAELVPDLDPAAREQIRAAFADRAGDIGPDTAIGLVPNLAASRIANRLDLRGPAYTVDAACASSLLAVDHACRELLDRRCDVVLAGGVHVCHDVTFWSVFTQLGALSRRQQIRPFDRNADGILIGEGCGIVVLKRLADAERDGDRVYAVLRGTGVSSDGREASPMRPRLAGQLAALDAAWRAAGCEPDGVGVVEAHGTATPTGDETELAALGKFFGPGDPRRPRAVVGSIKSMIGHAMPAAGAAGLIKTALAIHHGILPPSLHCDEPHPGLERTRFRVLAAAEPWDAPVRRAGVSAFGFGGINAHVVLEEYGDRRHSPASRPRGMERRAHRPEAAGAAAAPPRVLALAADSIAELRALLAATPDDATGVHGAGLVRLAVLDPTPERRKLAAQVVDRERPWRGNKDVWFVPRGFAADGGRIAFLYPGIEAAFAPRVADVAERYGLAFPDELADPSTGANPSPRELERRGLGVFALGRLLTTALARRGIRPDVIAGHSLGEWTAMVTSEMIPPGDVDEFVAGLPAGSLEVPDVVFAAVGCGATGAEAALDGLDAIAISHDNCPHQSVLCGRGEPVRIALERLGQRGVLCQELPFRSGFHSPLFADYLAPHRRHLAALALQRPRVPVWSATTCAPYPHDAAAVRALAIDHLIKPVRFRELIEALYAEGVRAFVQLGVGSLVGFVGDTLRGKDHLVVAAASAQHAGLAQLARVGCALHVEGFAAELEPPAAFDEPSRGGAGPRGSPARPSTKLPLDLGAPLVRLGEAAERLRVRAAGIAALPSGDPILDEAAAMLREAQAATDAIVAAYHARARARLAPAVERAVAAPAPPPPPRELVVQRTLSVDAVPALLDHCFYRQHPAAPVSDRFPVVPMTMIVALMLDAARAMAPGRVAIAVEDIRAFRWLAVAPPVAIELRARHDGGDRVDVEIPGYARASVRLADDYPPAPAPAIEPLTEPVPTPVTAANLYTDRWMFHGPRYAGVVAMGPMGVAGASRGVDGEIEVLPAPGELLDCAGQLMGWWVMQHEALDRLAMPMHLARIALYGDEPPVGARVGCKVRIRHVGEREVRADLELIHADRVWCVIDGWEDRRFDSDDAVWKVLQYPEHHALGEPRPGGWVRVTEHCRTPASRELMMRRYLGERERAAYDALGPQGKRAWLLGRIALKDAVRLDAWAAGRGAMFPAEVEVGNAASGAPTVAAAGAGALRASVAHKDDLAVAIVSPTDDVGIDVERVEPRSPSLHAVAFTPAEVALGAGRPADEWLARLWTAKEAVAKARRTGMTDPRKLEVTAVQGDRLTIGDIVADTVRDGDHVIAWTRVPRESKP
jgi:acyl transferase domain-containing protein/phosphopantetheinyl transferase (holo-ACP synthase)